MYSTVVNCVFTCQQLKRNCFHASSTKRKLRSHKRIGLGRWRVNQGTNDCKSGDIDKVGSEMYSPNTIPDLDYNINIRSADH